MRWQFALAMVVGVMEFQSAQGATSAPQEKVVPSLPAWIVATSPSIGATDVDPKLSEITVTFDRDMSDGMSWTGKEFYPPADGDKQARLRDKRTCVLPVKLKRGQYYRVGINSKSFLNFRSQAGEPVPSTAIYFVTEGATKSIASRVRVPQIAKMVPANGAADVIQRSKVCASVSICRWGKGFRGPAAARIFPQG